jgi:hypothetical protein
MADIMRHIGGDQVLIEMLYNNVDDDRYDSLSELGSIMTRIQTYMKRYKIGYKIKSFDEEKGALKKTRDLLQKWISTPPVERDTPAELKQNMKDEIVKYQAGQPNFQDYEIERIARTEISSMRELEKLLKFKELGFTHVKHNTQVRKNSGSKDKAYDGKVFEIDYLLKNEKERIPLHPNCRCFYTVYK